MSVPWLWGCLAGLAATYAMDVGAKVGRKAGWIGGFDPRLLGRWVSGIWAGRLVLAPAGIAGATPAGDLNGKDLQVAIRAHYAIGAALGALFFVGYDGWLAPGFDARAGLGYGLATNALPWFVMFPALGFGVCGLKGPDGSRLLRTSFYNHLVYGLALGGIHWGLSSLFA